MKQIKCAFVYLFFFSLSLTTFSGCSGGNSGKTTTYMVTPNTVSLLLGRETEGNARVPILLLTTPSNGGCNSASDIQITQSYNAQTLSVEIIGYMFTQYEGPGGCTADIRDSAATIKPDMNWLKGSQEREIVFKLKDKENKYKISYVENNYKVEIINTQVSNVFSVKPPSIHYPTEATALSVVLYPLDVGILYAFGEGNDYISQMREFAESKGWTPVEKVYEGIQQPDTDRVHLYVVVRNRTLPSPSTNEEVGTLSSDAGVKIYLSRVSEGVFLYN